MMETAFYLILKEIFVPKVLKFFSLLFGSIQKQLDYRDKVNFKIYDVKSGKANNFNTHIAQYLTKWRQPNN